MFRSLQNTSWSITSVSSAENPSDASLAEKLRSRGLVRFPDLKVKSITAIEIHHLVIETGFRHFRFEVLEWREKDVVVTLVRISRISPRNGANDPGEKIRVLP